MGLVRFYVWVIQLGLMLALIGQLKSCTLELLGLAVAKSATGIMSYSKYTKALTN